MQILPVYAGLHKQICSLEAWEILQEILRNFPCIFLFLRIIRVQSKVIAGLSAIYIVIYKHKEVRG